MADLELGDGDLYIDGNPNPIGRVRDVKITLAPLTLTYPEAARIARRQLEASVLHCFCGWFDREYSFPKCPNCGIDFDLLTAWWREMGDRFWGISKEELRDDFETWRILNAEEIG